MKSDLVTVVIPAYNHQDYVQEAIYSVINQTHKNIELVIFNDGSTDNTDIKIKELLPECKKRFARLEYISKENEGLAATLNRAIDWAISDYLYIIASDDVAMPQAVDILYDFLSKYNEYALAVGDNQIINEKSERCYWDKHKNNTNIDRAVFHTFAGYLGKNRIGRSNYKPCNYGTYKTLLKGNYITNGKMIRIRSLIKVGRFMPGMKFEDWHINLQLSKYYKMKFIDQILFSYRWHNDNSIKNTAYRTGSSKKVLEYERENHRIWFDKYADRRCKRKIDNKASIMRIEIRSLADAAIAWLSNVNRRG
jgi:alpha-1,3-rhamnosyltransferase